MITLITGPQGSGKTHKARLRAKSFAGSGNIEEISFARLMRSAESPLVAENNRVCKAFIVDIDAEAYSNEFFRGLCSGLVFGPTNILLILCCQKAPTSITSPRIQHIHLDD